jgi:hypothetical protein
MYTREDNIKINLQGMDRYCVNKLIWFWIGISGGELLTIR